MGERAGGAHLVAPLIGDLEHAQADDSDDDGSDAGRAARPRCGGGCARACARAVRASLRAVFGARLGAGGSEAWPSHAAAGHCDALIVELYTPTAAYAASRRGCVIVSERADEPRSLFARGYALRERIGVGASAACYRCRALDDRGRPLRGAAAVFVAKVVRKAAHGVGAEPRARARACARLQSEAALLAQLAHPCIVRLEAAFESASALTLVLELCAGGELYDHVLERAARDATAARAAAARALAAAARAADGAAPPPPDPAGAAERRCARESECARVLCQVASALACVHGAGVVHADLSAHNVLLLRPNDISRVKLIDFGLARRCDARPAAVPEARPRLFPSVAPSGGCAAARAGARAAAALSALDDAAASDAGDADDVTGRHRDGRRDADGGAAGERCASERASSWAQFAPLPPRALSGGAWCEAEEEGAAMAAEACVGTPGYLAPELTARRTRPRAGAATAAPAARAGAEHAALDEAAESSEPRPAAAACEAAAAAALCSSAVDIWALGVLAHVLLTARLPFPPDDCDAPPSADDAADADADADAASERSRYALALDGPEWLGICDALKQLLRQMLHVRPAERPSAAQVAAAPCLRALAARPAERGGGGCGAPGAAGCESRAASNDSTPSMASTVIHHLVRGSSDESPAASSAASSPTLQLFAGTTDSGGARPYDLEERSGGAAHDSRWLLDSGGQAGLLALAQRGQP